MRKGVATFIFLLSLLQAHSQYQDFIKVRDDWSDSVLPVVDNSLPYGYCIYDSLKLNFHWKQERFITLFAKRKLYFRVGEDQLDGDRMLFALPPSLDPFQDADSLAGISPKQSGQFFNVKINRFQGRKIEANGDTKRLLKQVEFVDDSLRTYQVDEPIFSYQFELLGLEPGDFVQVEYKYEIPYLRNWFLFNSFRVFFGGEVPKENFYLELAHEDIRRVQLSGEEPDTTISDGSVQRYVWSKTGLDENLYAVNSRPFADFPWVGVNFNTHGEIYKSRYSDGPGFRFQPYWVHVLQRRFQKLPHFYRISQKNFLIDRQNRIVNDFIEHSARDTEEDLPLAKAIAVHQNVNDKFEYNPDEEYYSEEDMSLENIGDHVDDEELRDISRFNFYIKFLMRLEVPFRVVLLNDSRFFRYSENYLPRAANTDFMFEIFQGNNSFLLWPKQNRGGLEVSEYPFYWEGMNAMHINAFDLWSDHKCDYSLDTLYYYDKNDNYRLTSIEVDFDSSLAQANFRSNVRLSGQMSTVLRNYMRYNERDDWVADSYYRNLWEIDEATKVKDKDMRYFQRTYPYKAGFDFLYDKRLIKSSSPIKGDYSSVVEIPFENWTNLIGNPAVLQTKRRAEPYYPDFMYRDHFNVLVKLPANYVWSNSDEFQFEESNDFASIESKVSITPEKNYVFSIRFEIKKPRVMPEDFSQVQRIYQLIDRFDKLSFVFKKQPQPLD